ncbi:fimbrillin family protein [Bacteroides sp. ET489]|uniref:fimbrillin family protein n=1 Tax=Bacteroides sp. ET489 TaxID=3057126 RepID=UPI00267144B7|nr:fimbrillin family protein [Bacteroides sp. ET489]MDO3390408.1 fimbrillin family protein [Bacteroides sp. ET489]
MKKFYLFSGMIAFAGILALNSCTKAEIDDNESGNENPDIEQKDDFVSFSAEINPLSRATDTKFDVQDNIGVFAVKSNGNDNKGIIQSSGNYADNVKYTYNGSRFTSSNGIEIEEDGTQYYYHAVYPYTADASDYFMFSIKSDQTGDNYTLSDLCTAHTAATSSKLVDLKFSHRLSKLIVNLEGSNWPSGDYTLKLNDVYTNASVDLNAMNFSYGDRKGEVIMAANGNMSYKAVLPPQTLAKDNFATLSIGSQDYLVTLNNSLTMRSGMQYEISLTYNNNAVTVEFTGDIYPWGEEDDRFEDVVPDDIREALDDWIPIYTGVNPPIVEGTYFADPLETVHCEDEGMGGYDPGHIVESLIINFSNQNTSDNTVDYNEREVDGSHVGAGDGAFISGSGNNFTAFFNVTGSTNGISTKTALIISGTKSSSGISNLYYAFVMVEKGYDPDNELMKEGVFRVFKDKDGLSVNTSWTRSRSTIEVDSSNYYSVFSKLK